MKVSELAERTGLALRQIRYLISEELVPHAGGSRTSPVYDERHVAAIERYKELSEAGYRPGKIRALLRVEELVARGGPIRLAEGVHLIVDASVLDPDVTHPRDVADAAEAVISTVIRNRKAENNAA